MESGQRKHYTKIERLLRGLLEERKDFSDNGLICYLLILSICLVLAFFYTLLAAFFYYEGIDLLGNIHACGGGAALILLLFLRINRYDALCFMLCAMMIFSSFLIVYIVGNDTFAVFYPLLVFIILQVVPVSHKRAARFISFLMPFVMILYYLFDLYHIPVNNLGADDLLFLGIVNICFASGGLGIFYYLERFVRGFVHYYTQQRLTELQDKVFHDPLTGLFNRHYAEQFFSGREQLKNRRICAAMADIDDFKRVNDTYGHDVGDVCLKTVAAAFKKNLRATDLVFRWGGEEFLLLLCDTNQESGSAHLDRIRAAVAEMDITANDFCFRVTITMGTSMLDPEKVEESVKRCDEALYEGKRNGKNQVVTK